jgi:threonine/homoserine/homoserine lactone efflux protein
VGDAVRNVLPLAVAVAIFPVPIIAAVLILGFDRGTAKGLAFVGGWSLGLTAVGAAALALAGAADAGDEDETATWIRVLLLGLGLLLLALAVKQWRGRPRAGEAPPMPSWMRTIGELTIAKAGATGLALSALNPKNAVLAVAAAAEIAAEALPAGQQVAVLLGFVVVASIGVLTPLVLSLALGDRSRELLDGLRDWMARHNPVIMAALFVLIGAKLIGDAVLG